MKEGRYFSKTLNTYVQIYSILPKGECMECGKMCKNPVAFVREDDEDGLEYLYGSECIKKLVLKRKEQ